MPDHDLFERWKRRRAETPVAEDFTDRVMASLHLEEKKPARRLARMVSRLFGSPAFRVGICSLALIVGLLRVLQIIVLFFADQPSR